MKSSAGILACLFMIACLQVNCGDRGKYRLSWQFADAEIVDASVCSSRGVDQIRISILKAGDTDAIKTHTARCYPAVRRGPALAPGTYDLKIEGLGFDGQPLRNPNTGEQFALAFANGVRVRKGGLTDVSVILVRAPKCADGVDNDGDGRVDGLDPGCWLTGDKGYIVIDQEGRHTYVPEDDDETDPPDQPGAGTIELTWTVRGGSDMCATAGPSGAQWTAVSINGTAEVLHPCSDGAATLAVSPGSVRLEAWLADDQSRALSAALTTDATVEAGAQVPIYLDFGIDDLLTDTLQFMLMWENPTDGCQDASPMVAEHSVFLEDPVTDATITAVLQPYGTPVDGSEQSFAACVHPPELLTVVPDLPVGRYRLSVWGRTAQQAVCWFSRFEDLGVGPGVTDPWSLTIERVLQTGLCAP